MTIIYIYICVCVNHFFLGGLSDHVRSGIPTMNGHGAFRQDVGEASPKNSRASPEQVRHDATGTHQASILEASKLMQIYG